MPPGFKLNNSVFRLISLDFQNNHPLLILSWGISDVYYNNIRQGKN
jgi:hypothetical protein